jgi:hypothetical protein
MWYIKPLVYTADDCCTFNNAIPMIDKLSHIKKRVVFARYSEYRLQAVNNNYNNQVYLELVINFDKGKK